MAEKKVPLYLPFIMILMVVLLCRNDLESKETEIASYILNNQETLNHMAVSALDGGLDSVKLIDGVNGVACWSGAEDSCVDFKYYSVGLGTRLGVHYGFYYSPEDLPTAYGGTDVRLVQGENGWTWKDEEHYGFTKKILDHWYYYEIFL